MLTERWPQFMAGCLRRHSEAVTLALIGRASTAKRRFGTRRYIGEGTDPKGDHVEFFTGNDKKYVGVWGAHSEGRSYGFTGRSILEVRADELPWFPDQDVFSLCEACEATMKACGLTVKPRAEAAGIYAAPKQLFDLEPEQVFTLACGSEMTLAELESYAQSISRRRSLSESPTRLTGFATLWDPFSTTPDRVSVLLSATGLCLHDFKLNTTHRWKSRAPPDDFTNLTAALREVMKGAWS